MTYNVSSGTLSLYTTTTAMTNVELLQWLLALDAHLQNKSPI